MVALDLEEAMQRHLGIRSVLVHYRARASAASQT
jgi:hypothetical protein